MRLDTTHRHLFPWPVDALRAALPDSTDPLWEAHNQRQQHYDVHAATRSLVIVWPKDEHSGSQGAEIQGYAPMPLAAAALACGERIRRHFGGTIVRLVLAELPVGARILPHRDVGALLTRTHRCHLPIVTSERVRFEIDGEHRPLEIGEVYEIDNTRRHAVANDSGAPRIHLICDVLPEGG